MKRRDQPKGDDLAAPKQDEDEVSMSRPYCAGIERQSQRGGRGPAHVVPGRPSSA